MTQTITYKNQPFRGALHVECHGSNIETSNVYGNNGGFKTAKCNFCNRVIGVVWQGENNYMFIKHYAFKQFRLHVHGDKDL
jgi:hypothetical protein